MSVNFENILNGTAEKRIQRGYKRFIENFTEEGSNEFKSVYEKENLSDIVENSRYIIKDPYNGIKFYEDTVINPAFCLFTSYESELQKIRNIIDEAKDVGVPNKQLSLYTALESKLVDLLNKTNNVRIITEYAKEYIDSEYEKQLGNIIYAYEKGDVELGNIRVYFDGLNKHTGILYTYFPFICENEDISPIVCEFVMDHDGKNWNKIERHWSDMLESIALMNKFYNDSYYTETVNKNIHNGDVRLIINSYIKESPVEKLDNILYESEVEADAVIHRTSDGAVMGLFKEMEDLIYEEDSRIAKEETANFTKFALDLTYNLMNTEAAICGLEDTDTKNYPLYEYFTHDVNPSTLIESIGKLSKVISDYESDNVNFFIEADEDEEAEDEEIENSINSVDDDDENSNKTEDNKQEEPQSTEPTTPQTNTFDSKEPPVEKFNDKPVKKNSGNTANKLQVAAQDLQSKQMKFLGKVKKAGNDVINAGIAIAQLPLNFVNAIKSEVKKLDTMDDNRRKAYMIEPGFRKKVVKNLKLAILYGSVAQTNLALIPFTMMVRGLSKEKDKRIKNELIEDLQTEIKVCEEKINDASNDGDRQAKYRLMRTKDQLEKELFRIKTNAKYI